MYVPADQWSTPEGSDPPPCFRQGDVVRLTWVRPELHVKDEGRELQIRALEIRDEAVVLVSACCDLVDHKQAKRKGVLISPNPRRPKEHRAQRHVAGGAQGNRG